MDSIKPQALRPADTIRIVSPSWLGGQPFVHRAMRGVHLLESLGYEVEIGTNAFGNRGYVSGTVRERLADLHDAFSAPHVRMVLATIGGTHAADLLRDLDVDLIRANPKIFMGFSDNTILHTVINSRCGIPTVYGPGLLTDWSEFPCMDEMALSHVLQLIASSSPAGCIPQPRAGTDELLDWENGADEVRARFTQPNPGWVWLRRGSVTGRTIGGCLETLQHFRGTGYWPDFDGKLLCVETSEECPSPEAFDIMFGDYERMGVLDSIVGLLVARPYGFDAAAHDRFLQYLSARVEPFTFPVVANMDFGHTSPMFAMPLGVQITIDGERSEVRIDEAIGVQP